MSDALPRQELWLKLMRMTTSPNDGEALTALRKATKLMDDAGWTWDKLLAGKITVVSDPFASIPDIKVKEPEQRPAPPPRSARPFAPQPTYPHHKSRQASRAEPLGLFANKYVGFCYCCGVEVVTQAGHVFRPGDHGVNYTSSKGYAVVCNTCNTTGYVTTIPAPAKRNKGRQSFITDLI